MLIKLKPQVIDTPNCPYCGSSLKITSVLWQGMHICAETRCLECNIDIVSSLPVGHTVNFSFQLHLDSKQIWGDSTSKDWAIIPLLNSLQSPQPEVLDIKKEVFKQSDKVIVLNCVDYLYGHCLLKLLNAQRHLEDDSEYGLIVIIQPFLRWMIPEGVAEVWTVDLPLRNGNLYYPSFNQFVQNNLKDFGEVYLSEAYSHPSQFDITNFTRVKKHDFHQQGILITFVWREDRLWCHPFLERRRTLKALRLYRVILWLQNLRIRQFFKQISLAIPEAKFAVAGLGKKTFFPNWIKDARVENFDSLTEKQTCQLYSDSRLIIGVHGSNMLLPSAHAGMTIDLMPKDRWGNVTQDVLYQENDPRLSSFKYRYLPITTNTSMIAHIAKKMVKLL